MVKWPWEKATDTQRSVNHITITFSFLRTDKVAPRENEGSEEGFLSLILAEIINQYIFLMDNVIFYSFLKPSMFTLQGFSLTPTLYI